MYGGDTMRTMPGERERGNERTTAVCPPPQLSGGEALAIGNDDPVRGSIRGPYYMVDGCTIATV